MRNELSAHESLLNRPLIIKFTEFFFAFCILFKEYIDIRELLCSQKDGREIIVGEGVKSDTDFASVWFIPNP